MTGLRRGIVIGTMTHAQNFPATLRGQVRAPLASDGSWSDRLARYGRKMIVASSARLMWTTFRSAADSRVGAGLAVAGFLSIANGGLTACAPLAMKGLVDALSAGAPAVFAYGYAALYIGALGVGRFAVLAQAYVFSLADQRLQTVMSAAAFRHLLCLPIAFHLQRQPGALMQAHGLALQGARLFLTHAGFTLLPAIVQLLIILVVVAGMFSPLVWIVVLAGIIGYVAVFAWGAHTLGAPTQAAVAAEVEAAALFDDGLTNIDAVKSAVAEDRMSRRYEALLAGSEASWRASFLRRLESGLAVAGVFLFSMAAIVGLNVADVMAGKVSLGGFLLLTTYMLQIIQPLELAGFALRDLSQGASYLSGWTQIEQLPAEQGANGPTHAAGLSDPPEIVLENVSFGYEPARAVLRRVDVKAEAGRCLAIVGPSGGGKSSVLRLIQGQYAPAAGRILVNGIPLCELGVQTIRRSAAVVSQDVALFNDTLRANLLFAQPAASEEALRRAIALARLDRLVDGLPLGLETQVGERGLGLSGGERQRVAIARAFLQDAPLLLLDEPTSALDPATEQAICADLFALARGRTTLLVTHRLALAARADLILVLSEGRIVERGVHAGLMAARAHYHHLWSQQVLQGGAEDEGGSCR